MNKNILSQKLQSLKKFPNVNSSIVDKFGNIIESSSDWDLVKINPFQFALQNDFKQDETVDLFIHAAKIGLFDFEWNLICPMCGGIVHSHYDIGEINPEKFHCTVCDIFIDLDLNNYVEVSFSIDPSVHTVNINPFIDYKNYRRYFFSPNYQPSKEFVDYFMNEAFLDFKSIQPDEKVTIRFQAEPNKLYRLVSADNNSFVRLKFKEEISNAHQMVDIDLLKSG
mgnify:FL=1